MQKEGNKVDEESLYQKRLIIHQNITQFQLTLLLVHLRPHCVLRAQFSVHVGMLERTMLAVDWHGHFRRNWTCVPKALKWFIVI